MRDAILLSTLLLGACAATPGTRAATEVPRVERGALVTESVPDIPSPVTERLFQYRQSRGASLQGWAGDSILVRTRFGDTSQIHRVDVPGGARRQVTFFPEPVARAMPAPDGRSFLFLKDVGGNEAYQIYRYDLASGAHRLLTDGRSLNENPLWSDQGDRFAFTTTRRNGTDRDVHVMGAGATTSVPVLERAGTWVPLDWSPDGAKLLVLKFISINASELHVVDVASGATTQFHARPHPIAFRAARFARDGKGIYYTSDEDSEFLRLRHDDLATGRSTVVSHDLPWDVEDLAVSRNGRYLAFTVNAGGIHTLHVRNLRTGASVRTPALPVGQVTGLAFDRAGRRLGFVLNGPRSPSDVFSFDVGRTALTRWTHSETGGLDASTFVEPTIVEFPSFDGRRIPAFYYRAPSTAGGKAPVLIDIHGGPESQARPVYYPMTQFFLRELGIAVLEPNVRGSSGYGKSYLKLDNGERREDSVRDIGALLDWVARQPELDASRVAVYGGSYGGYMALASMTHYNDRLRAGLSEVGISNFVTFLTHTQDYRRDLRRVEYGDERDPAMRAFLERISPLSNASKITRPMLIAQGANDPRVPVGEAEQIVRAIRAQGGEVWYVRANDEGHGFQKKPNLDYLSAVMVLFLQQHLVAPAP